VPVRAVSTFSLSQRLFETSPLNDLASFAGAGEFDFGGEDPAGAASFFL